MDDQQTRRVRAWVETYLQLDADGRCTDQSELRASVADLPASVVRRRKPARRSSSSSL
jgi:hypothetical protein